MLSRSQESIIKYIKIINSLEELGKATGTEPQAVGLTVANLTRKGYITSERARNLLKGTNLIKLLDTPYRVERVGK